MGLKDALMAVRNTFRPTKKEYDPEATSGIFSQIASAYRQGDSPRISQSNMSQYLGRYADQSWVFSCIKIIQSKAAGVPLKIYQQVGEDLKEVPDHPLKKLFASVNPMMNGFDLFEATHGFIELVGNSFWLLDMMIDGKPTELYPLNPSRIKIMADKTRAVIGYAYELTPGVVQQIFKPEEIVHFKNWNPLDDFYGLAPLSAARDSSDMIMNADQYNKAFFKNGAEPGGYLVSDQNLEEDDKKLLASTWRKLHQGVRKAHSVAILDGGLKFTASSRSHNEMQFGELKRMSREDVLTVFGIPPIMVGVFDEANYSNAQEQRKIFWNDCIIPRLKKIESVINERLVKPYDGSVIAQFDLTGIEDLAEDASARARTDSYNVQAGIQTINEIRKLKNLEPVPWGDTWWAPMGLESVDVLMNPPEVVPPVKPIVDPNNPDKPGEQNEPAIDPENPNDMPMKSSKKDGVESGQVIDQPIDEQKLRRDKIWLLYKGLTDRMERRWAPAMRQLFTDQEREVIHNLHASDWKRTVNQNKLDKMKNVKNFIDVILFDRTKAHTVFRREASNLMNVTIKAAAEKEIADYDLGIDFNLSDHNVFTWIANKSFKFSEDVNKTTENSLRAQLHDAIANGESLSQVEDRIAGVFDIARGSRTATIARTEVISASNEGAFESYKQSGVVEKSEWITSRDNRVREIHQIDGEQVDLGDKFSNGLQYPGDPDGEPDNVINCRCTIAPIVDKQS